MASFSVKTSEVGSGQAGKGEKTCNKQGTTKTKPTNCSHRVTVWLSDSKIRSRNIYIYIYIKGRKKNKKIKTHR